MKGDQAVVLYEYFLNQLKKVYDADKVKPGAFGQHMTIDVEMDGITTIQLESKKDSKAIAKKESEKKRADTKQKTPAK